LEWTTNFTEPNTILPAWQNFTTTNIFETNTQLLDKLENMSHIFKPSYYEPIFSNEQLTDQLNFIGNIFELTTITILYPHLDFITRKLYLLETLTLFRPKIELTSLAPPTTPLKE